MFHALLNTVAGHSRFRVLLGAGALVAGLAGLPAAAQAHDRGFHIEVAIPAPVVVIGRDDRRDEQCDRVIDHVWVPAVYQSVSERVWVPEVTATRCERVDIPAEYGYRDVLVTDYRGHRHLEHQQVLICPAHSEERQVNICIAPGHYEEQCHQQLICEGHYETRQVEHFAREDRHDDHRDDYRDRREHAGLRLEIPFHF